MKRPLKKNYEWVKTIIITIQESLSNLSEIPEKVEIFFNNEIKPEDEDALEMLKGQQVPSLLNAFKEELNQIEEVDEEFAKTIMKKNSKIHRSKREKPIYAYKNCINRK